MAMERLGRTRSESMSQSATEYPHSTRPPATASVIRMMGDEWGCKGNEASACSPMNPWTSQGSRGREGRAVGEQGKTKTGPLFIDNAVPMPAPWRSTPPNLAGPLLALPLFCHRLTIATQPEPSGVLFQGY